MVSLEKHMRYIAILFLLTQAVVCQTFDLLKNFNPNTRVTFSCIREGEVSPYSSPTDRFIEFRGTVEVTTDSITFPVVDSMVFSSFDSTRVYHLSLRLVGTETTRVPGGILATRTIDTVRHTTIKENTARNHRSGAHRIHGWVFPDTVRASNLCPHEADTVLFYRYPYYFSAYHLPSADTFDVRADTLVLRNRSTDCLDLSNSWEFRVTADGGLIFCSFRFFTGFDWSVKERYIQTSVTTGIPAQQIADTHILYPNYPNPVSAAASRTTRIAYRLAGAGFATVRVSDLLGRTVQVLSSGYESAGPHEVLFDAGRLPRGVYVYSLASGNFFQSRTLLLLE